VPELRLNLLSTKHDFLILFDKKRAYILCRKTLHNTGFKEAVITTASLHNDNLYHIDDMNKFIEHNNQNILSLTDDNKNKNINISQSRKRSAQIQYKNTVKNMNPLEILH
jgi:hypothetical protein